MGTVIEVRPGEGGDDAVVFAEELVDAVVAFSRRHGFPVTVTTGRTYVIEGDIPFDQVEFLGGVHRVQRIPRNAKNGRRHTSTASVAVMLSAATSTEDVGLDDVRVEVFRGSGPGGQHRNTSDSCVRMVHTATGITVVATESRSQHENRRTAFNRLQERLRRDAEQQTTAAVNQQRRTQIDSGERPMKQWTWNQQRNEVIDHRTGRKVSMRAMLGGRFPTPTGK